MVEKKSGRIRTHCEQLATRAARRAAAAMTAEGDSDLQVDGEALHRETRLKTEGVKLLGHRQQALKHTKTGPDEASSTKTSNDSRELELMLCVPDEEPPKVSLL